MVYPELSLVTLVDEYLMANSDRAFPVVDGDHLVGIVTTEDVRNVRREDWAMTRVRQVMTPSSQLAVATPDETGAAALAKLAERNIEQLPVVGADRIPPRSHRAPRHPALAGASAARRAALACANGTPERGRSARTAAPAATAGTGPG